MDLVGYIVTFTRETVNANQTFTAVPNSAWNASAPGYTNWLSNGTNAYYNGTLDEDGYQYLANTTSYPFGTIEATMVMKVGTGLVLGGQSHGGGPPTKGVYWGIELDTQTSQPIMFIKVVGVATLMQPSYGYGLYSEQPISAPLLDSLQNIKFTLSYGEASLRISGNQVMRLTFGNMLSADVKDSIESTSCRAGFWQKEGVAGDIRSLKVTQANNRRANTVAGSGTVTALSTGFDTVQNPWVPPTPLSPWAAQSPAATSKMYTSGSSLYIATDAAASEYYNAYYNGSGDPGLQDVHTHLYWEQSAPGYAIGLSNTQTFRIAVWADVLTGGTFGNYYKNG
jgi:hypothetical protein